MLHLPSFINKYKNRGYIALMSVIVISAVGVMISITLLIVGVSYQRSIFAIEEEHKARALVKACANIALEKIHFNIDYLGSENINFGTDSCNILAINKEQNIYTINTESMVGSILRKNKIVATRIEDPDTFIVEMNVDSWLEVADF